MVKKRVAIKKKAKKQPSEEGFLIKASQARRISKRLDELMLDERYDIPHTWFEFAEGETPYGDFDVSIQFHSARQEVFYKNNLRKLTKDTAFISLQFKTGVNDWGPLYKLVKKLTKGGWELEDVHQLSATALFSLSIYEGNFIKNCKDVYKFLKKLNFGYKLLSDEEMLELRKGRLNGKNT